MDIQSKIEMMEKMYRAGNINNYLPVSESKQLLKMMNIIVKKHIDKIKPDISSIEKKIYRRMILCHIFSLSYGTTKRIAIAQARAFVTINERFPDEMFEYIKEIFNGIYKSNA